MSYCIGARNCNSSGYCILGRVIRVLEFIMSVLVLGLTAYIEDGIGMQEQQFLRLALATSVISTAYLIGIFASTIGGGRMIIAAPILFIEFSLFALWVSSFAGLVHSFNDCDDWPSSRSVQGFYWINRYLRRCDASKASMSFSIIAMVYYLMSLILFFCNVILPIAASYGFAYLWLPVSTMNATLERGTGLRFIKKPELETKPVHDAMSSQSSPIRSEKVEPVATEPGLLQPQY